jgi:hypothetical protein
MVTGGYGACGGVGAETIRHLPEHPKPHDRSPLRPRWRIAVPSSSPGPGSGGSIPTGTATISARDTWTMSYYYDSTIHNKLALIKRQVAAGCTEGQL